MIEHKCVDCVFLKQINSQPRCDLGRLDYFNYKTDENNNPVLDRFCNTCRPESWIDDLSVQESSDLQKTVLQEVYPRIGVFVKFKDNIEDLKTTIASIKNQEIPVRYVVVLNPKVEHNESIQELLVSNFDYEQTKHHILQLLETPENESLLIDESFKHAKNGWAYVCNAGHELNKDLTKAIHERINIKMKPLVVVEPYSDDENGLLFQTALFKFLNGNKVKIFDEEEAMNGTFLEKVKEISMRSDPETFITWEKFYEA